MDYSQKKAKQKYLYDKPDVLTDKQTVKHFKKDISKYNRIIEKEIVEEKYDEYLYEEKEDHGYFFFDNFGEYGERKEKYMWNFIDLDNLPEGIEFN